MNRRVLLLLAAIVAALGAALFAPSSVSAARALLDWEDDLRPRSGAWGGDSDYQFIDINWPVEQLARWSVDEFNNRRLGPNIAYERLLNVNRRVWILPLRFAYKMSIEVRLNGYAYPGQPVPRRIETIVVIPTWTGGGKRFEAGYVTEWGPAYGFGKK